MQPLPAAVLLDLDDTILAFGDPEECWRTVCDRFMSQVSVSSVEELLDAIDRARDWYWGNLERHRQGRLDLLVTRRKIVAEAFSRLGVDAPDVARDLADAYAGMREGGRGFSPVPSILSGTFVTRASGWAW